MTTTEQPNPDGTDPDLPGDPEELREQIEHTRQELGETVEALVAKVDVKAQAKEKLAEVKTAAAERPALRPAALAGAALLVFGFLMRGRAKHRKKGSS